MKSIVELKLGKSGTRYISCALGNDDMSIELDYLKSFLGRDVFGHVVENKQLRDGDEYHITVMYGHELDQISDHMMNSMIGSSISFEKIGIGKASSGANAAYYSIVESEELTQLRLLAHLPAKDFHITLGFDGSDIHGVPKDTSTLIIPTN
ncbi:hypothetical protein OH460_08195 [Vibrio sp. Makdt]|uniref:hypothetical protein n=1 Tax=Vibrio sp. Makdt TaxID=2998828 RepID=UPI0022CD7F49|nr:hypothetical protein [Vibrio sp. Makdt]MDA0152279.1 hypothetical protein [Vibrio sp. Makdt]